VTALYYLLGIKYKNDCGKSIWKDMERGYRKSCPCA
jgi:hypothetical protein